MWIAKNVSKKEKKNYVALNHYHQNISTGMQYVNLHVFSQLHVSWGLRNSRFYFLFKNYKFDLKLLQYSYHQKDSTPYLASIYKIILETNTSKKEKKKKTSNTGSNPKIL